MHNLLYWLSRKIDYPLVAPSVMQISLTYRCNLRCKMCSIANMAPKEDELSTNVIMRAIDQGHRYGIPELLLTGGEPFLREDIFSICDYAHNLGMRSIITTNAAIIDDRIVQKIEQSQVNHIHVSLDGLEETHDFFRGAGTYKKATESISLLNQKRHSGRFFSLGVACTVMDKNVGQLSELVALVDAMGVDVINFQPLVNDNANFLDQGRPAFWLRDDDIAVLAEEIQKIKAYKAKHITVYEEPPLSLLVPYYRGTLTRADWVCFGGFKTVFICFEKGQPLVYSCHGICGNLTHGSLTKAWTSKEARALRQHSRRCTSLCLQSCYSRYTSQSLRQIAAAAVRKVKHG
jgi:MoaA/NifB/PqqE/SkfB family radical SAM enzyme